MRTVEIPSGPVPPVSRLAQRDELVINTNQLAKFMVVLAYDWFYRAHDIPGTDSGVTEHSDYWGKIIEIEHLSSVGLIVLTLELSDGTEVNRTIHDGYRWFVKRDSILSLA